MAYRNKTYICFDGDKDMHYYRLMTAWSANERFDFSILNAHDLNTARDTSEEDSIKRQLRERFANSREFIVLIGSNTRYLRKFVQWEMEVAVRLALPIIAVNLNGQRKCDDLCPPAIRDQLAVFVPFGPKIVEYALANWPSDHATRTKNEQGGAFFYKDSVYTSLGIS